ncbi:tRNA (guanosine(37)-N1)-methyltransferase TrmD [Haliovirga abyssi]|uniref:tRNA (guanine-N(1)-)-methyltransferase n=1 Tax=Haliovirga abyssi TaxID=2996794 RepID=A0AAU9DAW3_9FUSO|nr:tRNA (guanosine(37)-N1)-methyltransferase TrmD [Haliovirga abyssi]BDU50455.1 tRNA (guanine-N(1)-)-methyltransferase [Haliovirga abyssi]
MKINILTLFPNMFDGMINESIIKKALNNNLVEINIINIRDYAKGKHKVTDDYPFGGGPGMVLKPEPLFEALAEMKDSKVILTSPQGEMFNQSIAKKLLKEKEITIIAGHYEGLDERVVDTFVDMEISIGDYVLTGGELPAMVISDAIIRLIPNVLNNSKSFEEDSFYNGLLDHPHYTRPAEYKELKVPAVLLSGNHEKIRKWRLKEALKRTLERRPELIKERELSKEEKKTIEEILNER